MMVSHCIYDYQHFQTSILENMYRFRPNLQNSSPVSYIQKHHVSSTSYHQTSAVCMTKKTQFNGINYAADGRNSISTQKNKERGHTYLARKHFCHSDSISIPECQCITIFWDWHFQLDHKVTFHLHKRLITMYLHFLISQEDYQQFKQIAGYPQFTTATEYPRVRSNFLSPIQESSIPCKFPGVHGQEKPQKDKSACRT